MTRPLALCAATLLASGALAQPIQAPLQDGSGHPAVREAARLLRAEGRRIRPDGPARPRLPGLRPMAITSEANGNVLVVRGDEGELDVDWEDDRQLYEAMRSIMVAFYEQNPGRNPHFLVLNTTFLVQSPQAFYLPIANNVRGIGYEYDHDTELFDLPGVALNGIIFMNSYRGYLQNGPLGQFTFNQEIGHRWGTFVRFQDPVTGEPSDELLGRDCQHWSFFADADNSAMEGNDWSDLGGGRFATISSNMWGFNQLDRYLMGFVPKEAVGPIWYVRDAESWTCAEAFRGRRYNPRWEPPTPLSFTGEQVEVEGERVDLTIDDIIAVHGERRPESAISRRTWSAAFLLVARQNDTVDERAIGQVDSLRQSWERAFERAATAPGYPGPDLITTLDGSREDPPPAEGLALGDRCVRDEDCTQGADHCIGLGSGARICSIGCTAEAPCGEGFCCTPSLPDAPAADSPWYCLPASGEGRCEAAPFEPMGEELPPDAAVPDAEAPVPDAGAPDGGGLVVQAGSGGGDDGCRQIPGRSAPSAWLWLALPLLGVRRRRR